MANEYFDNTGSPPTGSQLSSAIIRAEFQKIEAGFDKLPTLATGANKLLVVNPTGTAIVATDSPDINGGTIDGAAIGSTTPSTGAFTTATVTDAIAVDTNTGQVASTAFVLAQAADSTSPMNGSATVGSSTRFARQDHVHPSDTSRAPTANPTFTGTVTIPDPVNPTDAANKQYVDGTAAGLDNHAAVQCATTAAITLSGAQTIDGYSAVATNRVLVKNQASSIDNGVYVVAAGAWTRATDWDGVGEVQQGSYVFVESGALYGKTGWTQQTTGTITVGTTAQVFQQFSAANNYSAGSGLALAGNTFSLSAPVSVALGGSGAASLTGILKGTGTSAFTPATASDVTTLIGATAVTNANNATHLAGGVAGSVHWQSAAGVSAFTAAGTSGQVLTSSGASAPTWTAQSALAVASAAIATNVAGGVAGAVSYQSAVGVTGFTAAGTSGQVLISTGTTAPTWVAQSSIAAGSAVTATTATTATSATTAATATALATARTIDGQSFNGTADITVIAPGIHSAISKSWPADADEVGLVDSAASNILRRLTWANLKATLKTYFDTLYAATGAFAATGANSDITSLSALTNGIVGTSGNQTIGGTKTFSTQPVLPQAPVLGVAVATTSGTSIDFTGIPSWVKKVTVLFEGVSTTGTSVILFRLGSGSAQTTGYTTQSWSASAAGGLLTSGFFLAGSVAAGNYYTGRITFVHIGGNTWVGTGIHNIDNASNVGYQLSGKVALSGALDMIRLTTLGGTDTFDAGSCNVLYE